jgi:phage shock protein PspC (stress-responsive transcriptional regulator)
MSSSLSYQLTTSQHERVERFLKQCAYDWRFLESKARSQSVYQLKSAIHEQLSAEYDPGMSDREFAQILKSIEVKPSGWIEVNLSEEEREPVQIPIVPEPASLPVVEKEPEVEIALDEDAVVLGVCNSWAEQFNASPSQIRAVWALAVLVTGPFAVTAYVLGYVERVLTRRMPAPKRSTLNRHGLIYIGSGAVIWLATQIFRAGIYFMGGTFTDGVLVLGEWDWIRHSGNTVTFWALFSLSSLSVLLVLPSQSRSRIWIQNSTRVILITYGILMSYGMGRLLTGFLLRTTEL